MKTFTIILLLSTILINATTQFACKSLGTVQKELNTEFKGMFSEKSLQKFKKEARELGIKKNFSFYQINTSPKLYLRKTKKTDDSIKAVELLQKLTKSYGADYKPFTYYINCIDMGKDIIYIFKNFENGRLAKVWFYRIFTENATIRHRLLTMKDNLSLLKKMNDLGIVAKGITFHDSEMLPIKNSEYLYRPNNYLFDNLSDQPISFTKTKDDVFLAPEERQNSVSQNQSMIYTLILSFVVFEIKPFVDEKSVDEQKELLAMFEGSGEQEKNDRLVEVLVGFFSGRDNEREWIKLIRGCLAFETGKRMRAQEALVVLDTLLKANPAPVPVVVPVVNKKKLNL